MEEVTHPPVKLQDDRGASVRGGGSSAKGGVGRVLRRKDMRWEARGRAGRVGERDGKAALGGSSWFRAGPLDAALLPSREICALLLQGQGGEVT